MLKGTASPSQKLDVRGAVRFGDTISDVADGGRPLIYASDGSGAHTGHALVIQARDGAGSEIDFVTGTTPTTRMTIDSSGNVLVGGTSAEAATSTTLYQTGQIVSRVDSTYAGEFRRDTDDGDIVTFRKDGTTVGSIGTYSTDLTIGTTDIGVRFDDNASAYIPWNVGTNASTDATIDLGASSVQYKDLYLSGGAYLGGTAAANLLDDYEEGTWTPSIVGTTGSAGTHALSSSGEANNYTKIGNRVYFQMSRYVTNKGSYTGKTTVTGLPFTNDGSTTTVTLSKFPATDYPDTQMITAEVKAASSEIRFYDGARADLGNDWADLETGYYLNVAGTYLTDS